ncbi:MAG: dihydrofolate reductase family protein [Leptolyngbya sp.]|nr:dihydrofolate reductase family protein [Candidatus Melainabacteria bacterium]
MVVTTEKASSGYLAHLRKVGISYLICGREKIDLKSAMKKLKSKFKLEKLLLEGGGVLNGGMLQAGLVDEISQLIIPIVDGGGPTVIGFFDTPGKASKNAASGLKLISQKTLQGGTQWLRYEVKS